MDTIKLQGKEYVINKTNRFLCNKCLFYHGNGYPNAECCCLMTKCYDFIVIREVNVIDRIIIWLKKLWKVSK